MIGKHFLRAISYRQTRIHPLSIKLDLREISQPGKFKVSLLDKTINEHNIASTSKSNYRKEIVFVAMTDPKEAKS